jgi:hypothetical protein
MIGTAAPSEALHAPYTMKDAKHARLDIMLYESVALMIHPAAVGLVDDYHHSNYSLFTSFHR